MPVMITLYTNVRFLCTRLFVAKTLHRFPLRFTWVSPFWWYCEICANTLIRLAKAAGTAARRFSVRAFGRKADRVYSYQTRELAAFR